MCCTCQMLENNKEVSLYFAFATVASRFIQVIHLLIFARNVTKSSWFNRTDDGTIFATCMRNLSLLLPLKGKLFDIVLVGYLTYLIRFSMHNSSTECKDEYGSSIKSRVRVVNISRLRDTPRARLAKQ